MLQRNRILHNEGPSGGLDQQKERDLTCAAVKYLSGCCGCCCDENAACSVVVVVVVAGGTSHMASSSLQEKNHTKKEREN